MQKMFGKLQEMVDDSEALVCVLIDEVSDGDCVCACVCVCVCVLIDVVSEGGCVHCYSG